MLRTANVLTPVLLALCLESVAAAQTAPPATAPPATAPPATAPPATAPAAAAPAQPPPYYYPPPGYAPYPPSQGYWVPLPAQPLKERSYQPGTPIPAGYHVEERHPRWALITGASMLGSAYLTGLLVSTDNVCTTNYSMTTPSTNCNSRWAMYVPVVGPFVDMSQGNTYDNRAPGDILIGIGQVAGAVFLILGLATTTPKLIPDAQSYGLTLAPILASGTTGLSLTLRNQ